MNMFDHMNLFCHGSKSTKMLRKGILGIVLSNNFHALFIAKKKKGRFIVKVNLRKQKMFHKF